MWTRICRAANPTTLLQSSLLVLIPVLAVDVCSCHDVPSRQGITAVWAVDESEKVRANDLDHWARNDPRNRVWDGKRISVFGARNEIVAFQLILEAAGSGAERVDVRLDSLQQPGYVLKNMRPGDDPFDFVGRRIEVFIESYINVTKRGDWWLASSRPLPDRLHTGWIPDALVPVTVHGLVDHGAGGAPFSIAPGTNQAVWVDLFVPKDAPAGQYTGTVRIMQADSAAAQIPVQLTVYDFSLSDTTHLHTHFFWGWPTIPERHGPEYRSPAYWSLFDTYQKFFHRHRLDLTDGVQTLDTFRVRLAGYYTGTSYTREYGYDGPGIGVGNQTYSVGTYDQPRDGYRSGFWPDTPEAWSAAADSWEEWFDEHAPSVVRFKYLHDEPSYALWPDVRRKALWIRSGKGVGRHLHTLVTTRIGEELYGAITFWLVTGHSGWSDSGGTTGYDLRTVAERKAKGEKVGFYNGQRPAFGEPGAIDDFATDARVNPWIAWKYGADMYSFWEVAYYASSSVNAWVEPAGGTIVYTGEDRKYPRDTRGIKGPIASIRMKNLRRGMQDYEYLWLAARLGVPVNDIVDVIVPAAFNDYSNGTLKSQSDQPTWPEHGMIFEEARRTLAERIATMTRVKER